jgi:hypothetical protein
MLEEYGQFRVTAESADQLSRLGLKKGSGYLDSHFAALEKLNRPPFAANPAAIG